MPVAAAQGTAGQLQEAAALAASSPAFAAAVGLQQAVVDLATDRLQLAPVHCAATGPAGVFAVSSTDGSAGACISAHRGGQVHWLSASALGNSQLGFGVTRLLGYVGAAADVPHFVLEQGLQGDKFQGTITLSPRQDWVTDLQYLHAYYNAAPSGSGLRSYNEIYNSMMATAEQLGWRAYTSPVAEVKPLLAASIAYTLPAQQDSLAAFHGAALEVARLWVALLLQGSKEGGSSGSSVRNEAALHAYDARYFSAITSDPHNAIAVKLFGEAAIDTLLKMATGHPSVAGSWGSTTSSRGCSRDLRRKLYNS